MTFDTLTAPRPTSRSSEYGLVAETMQTPPDRSWVAFTLRPTARFHDGSPDHRRGRRLDLRDAEDARAIRSTGRTTRRSPRPRRRRPRNVSFAFKPGDNRELPVIVGQLPVLSKAYWATRDFEKTTLEPPLGSGPYRVESLEPAARSPIAG